MDLCRGPDGTPGYDRVVELARYLVELREKPCISDREAADIFRLWDGLPDSDTGRFLSAETQGETFVRQVQGHPLQNLHLPWKGEPEAVYAGAGLGSFTVA